MMGHFVTKNVYFKDVATGRIVVADLVVSGKRDLSIARLLTIPGMIVGLIGDYAKALLAEKVIIDVKTGNATLSRNQDALYPAVAAGEAVVPFGINAVAAGYNVLGLRLPSPPTSIVATAVVVVRR